MEGETRVNSVTQHGIFNIEMKYENRHCKLLGHGTVVDEYKPRFIDTFKGIRATMVAAGTFHSLVVSEGQLTFPFLVVVLFDYKMR